MEEFAASHNNVIWTCLVNILGIDGSAVSKAAKKVVTLPMLFGNPKWHKGAPGCKVGQWVDALEMIRKHHPGVAAEITALDQGHNSPSITAVRDSKEWLEAASFEMPSWEALVQGARPSPEEDIMDTVATKDRSGKHQWCWRKKVSTNCGANVVPRRPHSSRTILEFPTNKHQQTLLDRIPSIPDVQSAWALLLHCATTRANYFIRVVPPDDSHSFAVSHDNAL